jgi:hypothetical protein
MPDAAEAWKLAEVLCGAVLLVCIFVFVNRAALAAAEALNKRR